MRGGLDRLQKEIDALTYNSRSVLNALIRSTVASGSDNGYTVTKAGQTISLTRVDIYRLYKFYQEWENNGFAAETIEATSTQGRVLGFHDIRTGQDTVPVVDENGNSSTTSTTDALVKHGKILFLNENTLEFLDSDVNENNYWLNQIRDNNNAKLISNSSPVPINLRTPVFDENLATTRYNQHPTYLFPSAYYILDILGYPDDGVDHYAGGNSWTYSVNESFNIIGQSLSFGEVAEGATRKTQARRNGNLASAARLNNVALGYDTHARSSYSFAMGSSSVISSNGTASVAIGSANNVSNAYSASVGGRYNIASANYVGVFGGLNNTVTAEYGGILAGASNVVGGNVYTFSFPDNTDATSQDCVIIDDSACEAGFEGTATTFGRNVILLDGNLITEFGINDIVRIFAHTTTYTNLSNIEYNEVNGDIYNSQELTILAVAYDPDTIQTQLTLSGDISGSGIVDGGRISRIYDDSSRHYLGKHSTAMGRGVIAEGSDQTALGSYNYRTIDDTLKFSIGSGTGNGDRRSVVEVFDDKIALYGTNKTVSQVIPELSNNRDYDNYLFVGLQVTDTWLEATCNDSRIRMLGSVTEIVHDIGKDTEYGISISDTELWLRQSSDFGYITVHSGTTPISSLYAGYPFDNGDVGIFASGGVFTAAPNINITATSDVGTADMNLDADDDMNISWGGSLNLFGKTFGALPTRDDQYAHMFYASTYQNYISIAGSINPVDIRESAFTYKDGATVEAQWGIGSPYLPKMGITTTNIDNKGVIGIQTGALIGNTTESFSLSLATLTAGDDLGVGNIVVDRRKVDRDGTNPFTYTKSLAWEEDRVEMGKWYDARSLVASITCGSTTIPTSFITTLKYTTINNTAIVKCRINLLALTSLGLPNANIDIKWDFPLPFLVNAADGNTVTQGYQQSWNFELQDRYFGDIYYYGFRLFKESVTNITASTITTNPSPFTVESDNSKNIIDFVFITQIG